MVLLTWAPGSWSRCGPDGLPLPPPSQAIGTVQGGVSPLEMNGLSDGFQKTTAKPQGPVGKRRAFSSPFSPIMANNRAIQWRGRPLSGLLGMAGGALYFSAVLASGWELWCSHPPMVDLIFSSLTNVPVTRKCHSPILRHLGPGPREVEGITRILQLTSCPREWLRAIRAWPQHFEIV